MLGYNLQGETEAGKFPSPQFFPPVLLNFRKALPPSIQAVCNLMGGGMGINRDKVQHLLFETAALRRLI